ncbi:baseplate multidomain protein megatron [Chachezhania antarctica]|uniref:baseplate multidomain protein megatron n=1 Tax=Chachezhania antarctica TaxID=2340860 RepID=UPI000EAC1729|nr:glycoside hydrolase/phage tail family protein [Chachezhania antarctica]
MTTIVLSAAGAALGGSIGGTLAGVSTAALGQALGAAIGQSVDQQLLGKGSEPVHKGQVDRFRLTQSAEGSPVPLTFGRTRVGGQVIWSTRFLETTTTTGGGGGKGAPSQPKTVQYSYSVSLAVALCEGEISHVSRVWANGTEVSLLDLNMTVHTGAANQLPDPLMEAVEGAGHVPAYRGTAYVVMENFDLGRFGNRVPQFSFEVVRAEQPDAPGFDEDLAQIVKGVAMIPGTGEYALSPAGAFYNDGPGNSWAANVNHPSGGTDFYASLKGLMGDLPSAETASLVVSWFGGDLRCGACDVKPKVESTTIDASTMPWTVSGLPRAAADQIAQQDGRPIYGGTPCDESVVEAIRHFHLYGRKVTFYPFVLMDQLGGNTLPDPWTGGTGQPALPWRGRITTSLAPDQLGTPDGTAAADAEVAAFFGTAQASDFTVGDGTVTYTGPDEWSLNRFILHYAALCAAAGGVHAFCIGSEFRALTQIRGATGFPAVQALRTLAAQARILLGPDTKIGYAADWSEYFGYQPPGTDDRLFHLDPLWADPQIDFIGIDNYMPLSDWREGEDHADAAWGSIYEPAYLKANIEGGEGYDWYYASDADRDAQIRTPITDGAHGEPWVWRYKDIRGWWDNPHHDRIGGVRQATATPWVPQSKPVWFTELGCAAVDKGTNQPNKFIDPKSSESRLPYHSNGQRDDFIQFQYLKATLTYWQDAAKNPVSPVYGGPMVDLSNAYVWAWDLRPYPHFPNNRGLWSDGGNHARGHWLNGRAGARTLASVVDEICRRSGVTDADVSRLYGIVHGFQLDRNGDARAALEPLMLRYGFDAVEHGGTLSFRHRTGAPMALLDPGDMVEDGEADGILERTRAAEAELAGRVRIRFPEAGTDHGVIAEEAALADDAQLSVTTSDLPLSMTRAEGRQVAERWLAEARVSRDSARFALPPSRLGLGAGDVVQLPGGRYRIDRVEQGAHQIVEAVRVEPDIYRPADYPDDAPLTAAYHAAGPAAALFLDLPLLTGEEIPHAPHIAVTSRRWPGSVAVHGSADDEGYALDMVIEAGATAGTTETALETGPVGLWDRGAGVEVRMISGTFSAASKARVLGGANAIAIGDGDVWEVLQFTDAELIATDTYRLTGLLRGQAGSDAVMPGAWPEGSWVVALNGVPRQLPLTPAQRGQERHYRVGPASQPISDPAYTHHARVFTGIGLRPLSPCHLRVAEAGGDITAGWIRRTRIDGDGWDGGDVPLGEEREAYRVQVRDGGTVLREVEVTSPAWTYAAADRAADSPGAGAVIAVSQISARFGAGAEVTAPLPV